MKFDLKLIAQKFLIPIVLAVFTSLLSFNAIKNYSYTTDEPSHLARGVMLVKTGDFRINQHHPFLFNFLEAIPVAFNTEFISEDLESENWEQAKKDDIAYNLVRLNGEKATYSLEFLVSARLVAAILSGIMLVATYLLVYINFGFISAVISSVLLAFSPTLIAHSSLVTTDVPAMYTIFIASIALYMDLKKTKNNPNHFPLFFTLTAFIAIISKYTATLILPFWLVIYVWARAKYMGDSLFRVIGKALLVTITLLGLLTAVYGFKVSTIYESDYNNPGRIKATYDHLNMIDRVVPLDIMPMLNWIYTEAQFPFPDYIKGFYDNVIKHNIHGHRTYLLGDASNGGNPLYFPVAFLIKETVPFLLLTIFSTLFIIYLIKNNKGYISQKHPEMIPLIAIPTVLVVMSLTSSINLGVRHLLPVYPFLTLGTALVITYLINRYPQFKKIAIWTTATLLLLHAFLTTSHYPIYLGYFNQIAGAQRYNYLYLHDSNFDWRQENHIFDEAVQKYQGTNIVPYRKESLSTNIKTLEKWELCLRYRYFSNEIKPVGEFGHNFFLFEIENKEALCDFSSSLKQ